MALPDLHATRGAVIVVSDKDPAVHATREAVIVVSDKDPAVHATREAVVVIADKDPIVHATRQALLVIRSIELVELVEAVLRKAHAKRSGRNWFKNKLAPNVIDDNTLALVVDDLTGEYVVEG